MKVHKIISEYGLVSKLVTGVLMTLVWQMTQWIMDSTRDGSELAMIAGAVLVPIIGMLKFNFEFADRKNDSH